MLCASLRATLSLVIARHRVWSVHYLYGPLPTTYTWGYYRSEVSVVFGTWLDKAHKARLQSGTRVAGPSTACRNVSWILNFVLHTARAWLLLRKCFHAQLGDPR